MRQIDQGVRRLSRLNQKAKNCSCCDDGAGDAVNDCDKADYPDGVFQCLRGSHVIRLLVLRTTRSLLPLTIRSNIGGDQPFFS